MPEQLHSTSGVLVSGALEPLVQELGIDSSIRTGESALNEINSVPVVDPEHLIFRFSSGPDPHIPQPVTVTSLTLNRLNGAESFILLASNHQSPFQVCARDI